MKVLIILMTIFLAQLNIISANSNMKNEMNLKNISISAVQSEYASTKKYTLISHRVKQPYFPNHEIFIVHLADGPEPIQYFVVAIDKLMEPIVFVVYKSIEILKYTLEELASISKQELLNQEASKFSKLYGAEKKSLKELNIKEYVKAFLFLISNQSELINNFEQIKPMPEFIKRELGETLKNKVKPMILEKVKDTIKIKFYSWNSRGLLLEWAIDVLENGKILKCINNEFFILPF